MWVSYVLCVQWKWSLACLLNQVSLIEQAICCVGLIGRKDSLSVNTAVLFNGMLLIVKVFLKKSYVVGALDYSRNTAVFITGVSSLVTLVLVV